ncbi:tyrosinase family oxidase copper chaperone, partial [Kitasatospora sp. NPDC058263]
HHHGGAGYTVRIDGDELHMMRNADGTWISVVNHYQTFATPRALARAAVSELQGATLVPIATV